MGVGPERKWGAVVSPEIVFYGDYTWVLYNDLKLVTMRKPDPKYDIDPGTIIKARCVYDDKDGVSCEQVVELVVIANKKQPLNTFTPMELMLDGFTSPDDGVQKLRRFYPGTHEASPMQAIFTLSKKHFDTLDPDQQADLLDRGYDALNDPDQPYRALSWRSMCFWFLDQSSIDENDCWPAWVRFVLQHNQFGIGFDSGGDVEGLVREITQEEEPLSISKMKDIILGNPNSDLFQYYVLLES